MLNVLIIMCLWLSYPAIKRQSAVTEDLLKKKQRFDIKSILITNKLCDTFSLCRP